MLVSIYKETEDTLTRIANTVMDDDRRATFIADGSWEVTHFSVQYAVDGPKMVVSLPYRVEMKAPWSLTLDLNEISISMTCKGAKDEPVISCDEIEQSLKTILAATKETEKLEG
jgi:hypothetical protein